jgi:hypothetical protein
MLVIGIVIGFVVGVLITLSILKLLLQKKCTKGHVVLATSAYGDRAAGVKFYNPEALETKSHVILKVLNQEESALK